MEKRIVREDFVGIIAYLDRNAPAGSGHSPDRKRPTLFPTETHNIMDTSKFITLRTFSSAGEASLCRSLLESNGLRCEILNGGASNVFPVPGDLSQIRLIVNEADAPRAEEILSSEFDRAAFDAESAKP